MVEGGTLSQADFGKELGKEVILFCHFTTRIKGRNNERLLREVGGTSFPSFFIFDAQGRVLGKHQGQRSIDGFLGTIRKAHEVIQLQNRIAAGDKAASIQLLRLKLEMGAILFADAKRLRAKIEDTSETLSIIDGLLAGLAYQDRLSKLRKKMIPRQLDPKLRREAIAKYQQAVCALTIECIENGQIPKGGRNEISFWRNAMFAANSAGDPDLLEKAIQKSDTGNSRMKPYLDGMRKRVQELRKKQKK
ncbi:MAG: hypothetical protein CSA62_01795 [Planctomycetota bacterium]|nr:MAG: hypothetical protein CSA62_01795 [Planctomycetota bacterium]